MSRAPETPTVAVAEPAEAEDILDRLAPLADEVARGDEYELEELLARIAKLLERPSR